MALKFSTLATGAFATPRVISNPQNTGAPFNRGASHSMTTAEVANDVVALFSVPTNIAVRAVLLSSDGAGAAGAVDIGLYTINEAGDTETAVDRDLFTSAQSVAGALVRSDVTAEAGTITIDERFLPLWQAAGLTADPGGIFWVCATVTTAVDATTLIAVEVEGAH